MAQYIKRLYHHEKAMIESLRNLSLGIEEEIRKLY